MKSSMLKEEKARITKLVQLAYKNDPRIKAEEEKINKEREKLRLERQILRQKEKEAAEERARQMKKEYEENLRLQQERLIKEKEELLDKALSLAVSLNIEITKDDKFTIHLNANIEKLKTILTLVEDNSDDKAKVFITNANQLLGLKLKCDESNESTIWKKEEIHLLQKAVKKYPAGTKNRWEKINEIVKTKSTNQIIQMTHYLTTTPNIKIENDILNYYKLGSRSIK
jgi:DnaJ family protein C protein 2